MYVMDSNHKTPTHGHKHCNENIGNENLCKHLDKA